MNEYSSVVLHRSMLGAAVMFAMVGSAQAQGVTAQAQGIAGRVSLSLPSGLEATVYASVPEGFEPNTATDQELLDYGYPARPDPSNAEATALWQRAVHTTRVPTDMVEQPGKYHRPVQNLTFRQTDANATSSSGNWSAVAVSGSSADFNSIIGYWAVPNVATQVAKTPNGYPSMWVGLDGDGTEDLIQDGTSSDWYNGQAIYNAWVEVLPAAETVLTGLKVNPGDAIYAATQYRVVNGKPYAYFYMTNFNTVKSVSATVAFPKNLKYTGRSAEWVVERAEIDGSFEHPMPNYGLGFMSAAYASRTGSSTLYPCNATPTSVGTTYYISMYDTPTKKTLSVPQPQYANTTIFQWKAY